VNWIQVELDSEFMMVVKSSIEANDIPEIIGQRAAV